MDDFECGHLSRVSRIVIYCVIASPPLHEGQVLLGDHIANCVDLPPPLQVRFPFKYSTLPVIPDPLFQQLLIELYYFRLALPWSGHQKCFAVGQDHTIAKTIDMKHSLCLDFVQVFPLK
jgi:hypothetical protein